MNSKQAKRFLASKGCTFEAGKGSHLIVRLGSRRSVLPMHGSKELGKGLWKAILKQLDLEDKYMRYAIRLRKDTNGTYLVTVPDLPEAITFGETIAAAKLQAVDAIETAMMSRIADRDAIPLPKAKGRHHVELRPATTAKVALWNAMVKQGLGKAALARKLKWHLPQVDRVLDVRHESTISTLTDALTVAGYALSLNVSPSRHVRRRQAA